MPALFFDCSSGISGDMTVAALLDLGIDREAFLKELAKLGLNAEFHIHISQQSRQMITGTKFDVHVSHSGEHHHHHDDAHGHSHSHSHAHGRSHREIRELIQKTSLSDYVRSKSLAVFHRIAVAEGRIHGCPADDVEFHEVGAVDSIVDIVGACIAFDLLGQPAVYSSHLFDGTGTIQCAHGAFPLPAPATLEILKNIPIRQIDESMEFLTPTGAALIAEFSAGFGPMPLMRVERIGYGLGTRDTAPRPNVLRISLGQLVQETPTADTIIEIVTNLDDVTPEIAATFPSTLLELGALDAFMTPVQMKKNRPGVQLTVLSTRQDAERLSDWMLAHTNTFGVRMHECRRMILDREIRTVSTPFGEILVKLGYRHGHCIHASPEFESYAAAAQEHGAPLQEVYVAALHAASSFVNKAD